jgi:predicted transcriptional regulator
MHNRLNFACPYCGDSADDASKKRGNLFWNTLQYHCYNCNKHAPLNSFLKRFGGRLSNPQDNLDIIDIIKTNKLHVEKAQMMEFELFKRLADLAIDKKTLYKVFNCGPVKEGSIGYKYLRGRFLGNHLNHFAYDGKRGKLYILNFGRTFDKIIGFQIRNLINKKEKYLSYNIEKIRSYAKLEIDFVDSEEADKLNKLSTIFGILHINFQYDYTLFEGPIDAKFMKNTLGLATVARDTSQFDEMPTVRYMFDNDKAGKDAMFKKLKKGKRVFLWSKFLKDFKLDIYNIKDLNDLVKVCYKNKKSEAFKSLDDYFSDNKLDSLYL